MVTRVEDVRTLRREERNDKLTVALVPTMGALHAGHMDLIKQAARLCDHIYVSIYVNPTQFGVNEDLDTYPRTMDEDLQKLRNLNEDLLKTGGGSISCVFTPRTSEMYPFGLSNTSLVIVNPQLTQVLEGKARPTFFQGVTTVVMKFLNIVEPDCVFFGQKDIQQLVVIERMVQEFSINTKVYRCPTQRHESGLARSSRNAYLGHRRRSVAPVLFRALRATREFYATFERPKKRAELLGAALEVIKRAQDEQRELPPGERVRFELEYLSLADPSTLKETEEVGESGAILSGAIVMLPLEDIKPKEALGSDGDANRVRLIDNMLLGDIWHRNTSLGKVFSTGVRDRPSFEA